MNYNGCKNEEFPYRNFYLKLIIIIVVVAFVVCISNSLFSKNKETTTATSIFSNNIELIKNKAIKYYTEDNIPKVIGKSTKISLEEMINMKLLTPIIDNNKKICNNKKSYIKLTKKDDEYQLKVNLVCDNNEDYIVAHLNNNSYCDKTYLCEIKNVETDNTKTNIEKDKSQNNTNSNITRPEKRDSKIIKKYKKVRKTKITVPEKGTISITDTTDKYKYEYVKTTNSKLSNWSVWSNPERISCTVKETKCNENDINCLKEIKIYSKKEETSKFNNIYTFTKSSLKNTTNLNMYVCASDNYIKIDDIIYKIDNIDDYKLINNIDATTKKSVGGWNYDGQINYQKPPSDTYNTHYIFVKPDYRNCNTSCNDLIRYYYDKYTYTKKLLKVTSYICDNNKNKYIPVYSRINDQISFTNIETIYETVCYKSERTRKVINNGTIIKKWSKYNDINLLKDNYQYTGNKKLI